MTDETVFGFRDLYLYGGLFDIVAVRLERDFAGIDVYDIRHILCALIGIPASQRLPPRHERSRAPAPVHCCRGACRLWLLVRQDVQSYQGHSARRRYDRCHLHAGSRHARAAASALRRRAAVRLADGMCSRHSRFRAATGILRRFCGAACDASTPAKGLAITGRFFLRSCFISAPRLSSLISS